MQSLLS